MPARVEESVQEPKHALKRRGAADSEVSGEVKNVLRQRMYDPASALQFNSSMNMDDKKDINWRMPGPCLLYTSPSPRDGLLSRMPSSA